jgi:hypothetical protein
MKPLMLDLNFLPRDNGPPSSNPDYEELRRQKFAKFEMQCSKVRTAVAQAHVLQAQQCYPCTWCQVAGPVGQSSLLLG